MDCCVCGIGGCVGGVCMVVYVGWCVCWIVGGVYDVVVWYG